ncbi:hypothetical protein PICSAR181_04106 [Mycobacterium avium subsp. paratuberculosis]|nr:hypothetical protein PICSAR181_04106 [Mycobacterium avium subsp. paratuberculosis]
MCAPSKFRYDEAVLPRASRSKCSPRITPGVSSGTATINRSPASVRTAVTIVESGYRLLAHLIGPDTR